MSPSVVSCGVVIVRATVEVFVCHATGTNRWDLPKGLGEAGESPLDTALRECWEETSLRLEPAWLVDLGRFDYLPQKQLHLFGLAVGPDALDPARCRCQSTFVQRCTGRTLPEVDGYAWKPLDRRDDWCGKNLTRVLGAIDLERLRGLPAVAALPLREHFAPARPAPP